MNSLWLSENKNDKFESLSNNIETDVCIIGAGIFGMTCGYYLSKAGLKVTIVEKDEIGHKTTGHTTAKIKLVYLLKLQVQFNFKIRLNLIP